MNNKSPDTICIKIGPNPLSLPCYHRKKPLVKNANKGAMKNLFEPGDQKTHELTVKEADTAAFGSGQVHPVYATFALARDAEWACRLFVLEMKEKHEEGIGTSISVDHQAPAVVGDNVKLIATVKTIENNTIICTYQAFAGKRLIARGEQSQKILPKAKLDRIFSELKPE